MKKGAIALAAVAAAILALSGCGGAKAENKVLYIYNWTYYIPDDVVQDFQKEFSCKVVYDVFSSNEDMFAKIKAGGSGYDVVFPGADFVSIMIKEGMLEPLDPEKIPNLKNLDPAVTSRMSFDPGSTLPYDAANPTSKAAVRYSVPYFMGATGVVVNKKIAGDFERSWNIFERSDLKKKMTLLDDPRETIGAALKYLGYSVNSVDTGELAKAEAQVKKWLENVLRFDSESFGKGYATGEYAIVHGWAENVFLELDDALKADAEFFIPREGGVAYMDCMAILKGSKNKDLAHAFINYIQRPDIYARIASYLALPSVNAPARALLTEKPNYTEADLARSELKLDIGEAISLYSDAWKRLRLGD